MRSNGRLGGKTAVITGGAAGIGRATSLMFAREGARVAIIDIQEDAGRETIHLIEETGGTAYFFHADVSKAAQVDQAFDAIREHVGGYDILFNHAGTIIVKPLHTSDEEDYDRLMDINVRSAFLVCRRALPEMGEDRWSSPRLLPLNSDMHLSRSIACPRTRCSNSPARSQWSIATRNGRTAT